MREIMESKSCDVFVALRVSYMRNDCVSESVRPALVALQALLAQVGHHLLADG